MSSCPHLDPASLLAQRAVSIRLGRRTTGCPHALSAIARRAPLNDSSIQGSIKQASTSASAPTQLATRSAPSSDDGSDREHQSSSFTNCGVSSSFRDASSGSKEPLESTSCVPPQRPSLHQGRNQQGSGQHFPHPNSHQQHPIYHNYHTQQPQPVQLHPPPLEGPLYPAVSQNRTPYQPIYSGMPPGPQSSSFGAAGLVHDSSTSHPVKNHYNDRGLPSEAALMTTMPLEDSRNLHLTAASDVEGAYSSVPCWVGGNLHDELLACRSIHSVQRFLMLNRPRLDDNLLGRAVVHLDHLVSVEPPDSDRQWQLLAGLLDGLMQRLRGRLSALDGSQLAATLCALSRLRAYDGELLREAAWVAQERADGLTTRQAAGLVWSFAGYHRTFRFQLEPGWVAALLEVAVLPRLLTARPPELAMTLYGIAVLCPDDPLRPPSSTLTALLDASRNLLPEYGGRELSMSMWALATLRHDPGPDWLAAFLQRCEAATRTFASGSSVVNVLYGLAVLERSPPAAWMQHFLWQAQRRMNTMDAQTLVMLGWALGKLRYRPDPRWGTAYLRYLRVVVLRRPRDPHPPGLSTQQVAALPLEAKQAEVLRQQQLWRQQQNWLRKRWDGAGEEDAKSIQGPSAGAMQPQMLRRHPHSGAVKQHASLLPTRTYNNLLCVLVRLSYRPNGVWMLHLCRAVQPRLHTFPPNELAYLLWAIARLSFRPQADWLMECCAALRVGLRACQPMDSVRALIALGRLKGPLCCQAVDGELVTALAARSEPLYDRLQTPLLLSVLRACAHLESLPPARVLAALSALRPRAQLQGDVGEQQQQQVMDAGSGCSSDGNSQQALTSGAKCHATTAAAAVVVEQPGVVHPDAGRDGLSLEGLAATQPNNLIASKYESNAVGMNNPTLSTAPNMAAVLVPHSSHHLTPLSARECANAVLAVGSVAARHGGIHSVRVLCGQLLLELLRRAEHLALRFNGLDLLILLQGVVAAGLRPNGAWLRRHELLAAQRLAAGALNPGMLQGLHKMYLALGYEPSVLAPPPPPAPPQQGAAAATVAAVVPRGRKQTSKSRVVGKRGEAAAVSRPTGAQKR